MIDAIIVFICRKLSFRMLLILMSICLYPFNNILCQSFTQPSINSVPDSLISVQFIALNDCTLTFDDLEYLGSIIKEDVGDPDLCRYSVGYFLYEDDAYKARRELILLGYRDAFLKKNSTRELRELADSQSFKESSNPIKEEADLNDITEDTSDQINGNITSEIDNEPIVNNELPQIQEENKELENTISASPKMPKADLSILYTGKSYGVLGNTRFQNEHELATAYAVEKGVDFKLVSHACWRTKGITIFMPSDEPLGHELVLILEKKDEWEKIEKYPSLLTHNTLLFRDPDRDKFDMLRIIKDSKMASRSIPELTSQEVTIYRTYIEKDKECIVVVENDHQWPENESLWQIGEINRLDFGKTGRLYELPINHGNFGARIHIVNSLSSDFLTKDQKHIKVDLGHQNGVFNLSNYDRAHLDLSGLSHLGYKILVPFEFEFSLLADEVKKLNKEFPDITWLSTNVSAVDSSVFTSTYITEIDDQKVGFVGLVDPSLKVNLSSEKLKGIKFLDINKSVQGAINELYSKGVNTIVALSNMTPEQNAIVSRSVKGIDIMIGCQIGDDYPHNELREFTFAADRPRASGRPMYTSHGYDRGIAVGQVDIYYNLEREAESRTYIKKIRESHHPVNDRLFADNEVVNELTADLQFEKVEKGKSLIPSFKDLAIQQPKLTTYDEVAKHGRISKSMWEKFLSNQLRKSVPAEVSFIRKMPSSFLPQIGKLHEREVRSWLWMDDNVVVMDMKGRDIRRLVEADRDKELIASGISHFDTPRRRYYFVMGQFMREDVFYRVATTDIVEAGEMSEHFRWGIRNSSKFVYNSHGHLKSDKNGEVIPLREFVINDLKRIRKGIKGEEHHKAIANIISPIEDSDQLFSLRFNNPTIWSSFNKSYKGDGYETVPESRIISNNSFIIGAQGGFTLEYDRKKALWSFGSRLAFANQSADQGDGIYQKTETMDDLSFNLTYLRKGAKRLALHPFGRLVYDTEFTATLNNQTELNNPKQSILRGIVGLSRGFSLKWPVLEFGLAAENDFSSNHYQYGVQGRSMGRFPLDKYWNVMYVLTNNFNYYLPTNNDTNRELSFKYNMVHELLVPLTNNVSISVAGDFFFFQGKTDINNQPGANMMLRLGLTYNRLWKPKYQPLF